MMMSGFSCIAENCFSMESMICRQIRKISNIYDLIANTNQISSVFYKSFYKARVATFFEYLKRAGSLQVLQVSFMQAGIQLIRKQVVTSSLMKRVSHHYNL